MFVNGSLFTPFSPSPAPPLGEYQGQLQLSLCVKEFIERPMIWVPMSKAIETGNPYWGMKLFRSFSVTKCNQLSYKDSLLFI